MRILGIDPGSRVTGWAVLDGRGSRLKLVEAGNLRLPSEGDLAARLADLRHRLNELIERHQPELVAVESVFSGINPQSLIRLSHARGVILELVGSRRLPLREPTPQQVKNAVCGWGRADKQQVQKMVATLLGPGITLPKDASDAAAVAITAQAGGGIDRAVAEAGKR